MIALLDTSRRNAINAQQGAGQWLTLGNDPDQSPLTDVMDCYGYLVRANPAWLANSPALQRSYGLLAVSVMVGEVGAEQGSAEQVPAVAA